LRSSSDEGCDIDDGPVVGVDGRARDKSPSDGITSAA
jgi:hypothetical protein